MRTIDTYKHQKILRIEKRLSVLIKKQSQAKALQYKQWKEELSEVKGLYDYYQLLKSEIETCICDYNEKYHSTQVLMGKDMRKLDKRER